MKFLIRFFAISFSLAAISCTPDEPTISSTIATYNTALNGANEVPVNSSSATGNATLAFNPSTKKFSLTVTYNGLVATSAHIHKYAIEDGCPVIFPLSTSDSSITYTSDALNADQESDLNANLYYVTLHSASYPEGEIRGALIREVTGGDGTPPPPPGL